MIPGVRIRDMREALGWSTTDLARACNMRETFLLDIESGVVLKVHTFTYRKIADALGVTLGQLMGEDEIPAHLTLEDAAPEEYRWLIKNTMAMVITLGVFTLTIMVFGLFGLILNFLLGL